MRVSVSRMRDSYFVNPLQRKLLQIDWHIKPAGLSFSFLRSGAKVEGWRKVGRNVSQSSVVYRVSVEHFF